MVAVSPAATSTTAPTTEQNPTPAAALPLPLLPPDTRRLGGEFDVPESGRRVVRY